VLFIWLAHFNFVDQSVGSLHFAHNNNIYAAQYSIDLKSTMYEYEIKYREWVWGCCFDLAIICLHLSNMYKMLCISTALLVYLVAPITFFLLFLFKHILGSYTDQWFTRYPRTSLVCYMCVESLKMTGIHFVLFNNGELEG